MSLKGSGGLTQKSNFVLYLRIFLKEISLLSFHFVFACFFVFLRALSAIMASEWESGRLWTQKNGHWPEGRAGRANQSFRNRGIGSLSIPLFRATILRWGWLWLYYCSSTLHTSRVVCARPFVLPVSRMASHAIISRARAISSSIPVIIGDWKGKGITVACTGTLGSFAIHPLQEIRYNFNRFNFNCTRNNATLTSHYQLKASPTNPHLHPASQKQSSHHKSKNT